MSQCHFNISSDGENVTLDVCGKHDALVAMVGSLCIESEEIYDMLLDAILSATIVRLKSAIQQEDKDAEKAVRKLLKSLKK